MIERTKPSHFSSSGDHSAATPKSSSSSSSPAASSVHHHQILSISLLRSFNSWASTILPSPATTMFAALTTKLSPSRTSTSTSTSPSPSPSSSRRPRLERRNASKNIDYDPSSSWAPSTSSHDDSLSQGFCAARSLELHPPCCSQTSFRIEGIDGEVDRLCRDLGLSGPEDFAIPAAAWEACKARSSLFDSPKPQRSPDDRSGTDDSAPKSSGGSGDGGIKGVRPPVLTPPPPPPPPLMLNQTLPPPPAISLPVVEKTGSTWDLLRSFAPEEDEGGGGGDKRAFDSEEEGERLGETAGDLTGSCSFSTSHDDDSSSTTTETAFVISPNGRFKRIIRSWIRGGLLGSGSFGTVYEGISEDGFFFAVKEVSLLDQGSDAKQCILQLEQEIALLSQFEHENIVQYFGTDKEEAKLYIFLELVTQGSLASLYQKYHLQDSQVSAYTRQILNGLKYLHDKNVVHRDIKCANILVDASGFVKLADFGLAKEITKLNVLKSCKGSVYWMAPEVINPKIAYGPAADIWSLGCTVLEMLTRQVPYPDLEWAQAFFKIGHGEPPPIPNTLSRDARDFIQRCVQVDADDRPSASQLLEHPFVKRPLSAYASPDGSLRNGNRRR